MTAQNTPEPIQTHEAGDRLEYSTPVLVEYGDIHEITQGGGQAQADSVESSFGI